MTDKFVQGKPKIPEVSGEKPHIQKPAYTPYEERILKVLSLALRPLTTRQVSQYSGISYNSVKNNLRSLQIGGVVKRKDLKNRIYWYR